MASVTSCENAFYGLQLNTVKIKTKKNIDSFDTELLFELHLRLVFIAVFLLSDSKKKLFSLVFFPFICFVLQLVKIRDNTIFT